MMKMALIKYPGIQYPQIITSDLSLASLQTLVGGFIEIVTLRYYEKSPGLENVVFIVRDDGAIIPDAKLNIQIGKTKLFGNIVVAGMNNNGELRELTKNESRKADFYLQLKTPHQAIKSFPEDLFGGIIYE